MRMSRWSWRAYACLGVCLTLLYFLVHPVAAQDIVYSLVGASAVAAIIVGVSTKRPRERLPWYLMAAGQACFVVGDVLWDIFADVLHSTPFPSVADVLYLAGYPLLAAGLALMVRDRDPERDRASLIDALIISAGLAVVTWVFWIDRYAGDQTLSLPAFLISAAYPIMDLLLISFLARLTLSPGKRPISYRLLSASLFLTLGADVAFAGLELAGAYNGRNLIDVGWLLSYVAVGAAALHPTMGALTQPAASPFVSSNGRRLVLLAGASLMVPCVFAVQALLGEPANTAALALGSGAIFLLVLARMAGLIKQVEWDAEQLRHQGDLLTRALEKEQEVVGQLQALNRLKGDFVARSVPRGHREPCDGPRPNPRLASHGTPDRPHGPPAPRSCVDQPRGQRPQVLGSRVAMRDRSKEGGSSGAVLGDGPRSRYRAGGGRTDLRPLLSD